MRIKSQGTVPDTWEDGTPVDYMNWKQYAPYQEPEKTCVFIRSPRTDLKTASALLVGFPTILF